MKKYAFTLVELIVVITVLAVLGTIAFISLQGYTIDARDALRISDMGSMKKSLEYHILRNDKYPQPHNYETITFSGANVWNQGTFGEDVVKIVGSINKAPIDPASKNEYTYSLASNGFEYQIGGIFEGDLGFNNNNVSAELKITKAFTKGNYNGGTMLVSDNLNTHILALPSIIASDIGDNKLETYISENHLVYNGKNNLPASYSGGKYDTNGGDVNMNIVTNLVIYSTSNLSELSSGGNDLKKKELIDKLQLAYSGTNIVGNSEIDKIMSLNTNIIDNELTNYIDFILGDKSKSSVNTTNNN